MQFLYINVLFFMLVPALILMFLIIKRTDNLSKYFSKKALEKLSVSNQYFSNKARNITLLLSLLFMIIALARPVANEKIHTSKKELNSLIIAVDVSRSMLATDIHPNRLEFAKKKLLNIIDNSKNSAIGIVLFAKSSFILSPLTQDFKSLRTIIENLDTGMNFDNGTNIYSTLEATNKLLKDYKNKNLLLLTDGGDKKNFDEEVKYANKNNIDIYTIAMSTKNGAAIKLKDGNFLTNKNGDIVTVKLNEKIKQLSLETDGGFINFSLNNGDINAILNDVSIKSTKNKFNQKSFKTYTELFYYPLALAILFLLISFSSLPKLTRKSTNTLVALFSIFLFNDLQASILDFQTIKKANDAYEKKDYQNASKEYEKLDNTTDEKEYNLANSLYKEGKYEQAISRYKNIKSENRDLNYKKLHNIGNAYAKLGDLENAKKSYEEALKIKNDKQTNENLKTIKKALEKKQKNKDNKQKNKDDKNKDSKKNKNKKNKNENKDSKENKNEDKKEESKEKKNKQKSQEQKNKEKKENKSSQKAKANKSNSNKMSDKEEKKWLEQLKHQKTNSLLKKLESSKEDDSNSLNNPW